tara:strand:- start:539 stop:1417 length:879 start_codon:yes stop_codon:yes gene_type:complete
MTPEELLKKGEALAKRVANAKANYDEATGEAKKKAKKVLDELEAAAKAAGKKASSGMQDLKKAGSIGSTIASFWSNPITAITKKGGLKDITDAASSIGSALKKGYDFSRKLDTNLFTSPAELAKGVAKTVIKKSGTAEEAKKKKDAEVRAKKGDSTAPAKTSDAAAAKKKDATTAKKGTYASAKKKDPKLDSYIAQRKKLKKGTAEYNRVQNKINAAYSKGPQREAGPTAEEKKKLENINFTGKGSLKSQKEAADKEAADKAANEKGKKTAEELEKSLKGQLGGMRARTKRG